MEKRCEFCKALSPAVYCKSDAALLCLSCDAKVHSANALSFRHPRTLVCDSCRYRPSLVRCLDHEMFMCQGCDAGHHALLHHRRKVVGCYVGCPSAKDLAQLWGFDLKQLDNNCFESEGGTSTRKAKVINDDRSQKSSYLILVQQILDLERLQLSDSCSVNVKEKTGGSPFRHDTMWKEHEMLDKHVEGHLVDDGKTEEPMSSPFPQLDNLNGDSFWQYKSPLHNNEIWLQNMQDIGVCDEVQCFDDVEIPDVDLTFRNFEEIFGNEQEASREDENIACSFAYNHPPSFGTIEETNDVHQLQTNHHDRRPIWPSYSASSFSVSRITGESSGSEYKDDDGLSPTFPPSRLPHDSESVKLEDGKENAIARYKGKRVLRQEKQGHYTPPRSKLEFKKCGKSQVM
ncbi:hypothetical protein ACS0TY_008394 [Phlomoides rotata]